MLVENLTRSTTTAFLNPQILECSNPDTPTSIPNEQDLTFGDKLTSGSPVEDWDVPLESPCIETPESLQRDEYIIFDRQKITDEMKSLVRSAQEGKEKAQEDLYLLFFPRVLRYVDSKLVNHEDAEDVTCEIFIRVLQNLARYEDRGLPIGAWIFRIARNEVVSHIRRSKVRETVPFEIEKMVVEDEKLEIVDPFDCKRLNELMKQVPPAQKAVLQLRFYADKNIKETASELKKTENNVKALQHKGIERLQTLMGVNLNTSYSNQVKAVLPFSERVSTSFLNCSPRSL